MKIPFDASFRSNDASEEFDPKTPSAEKYPYKTAKTPRSGKMNLATMTDIVLEIQKQIED